MKSPKHPESVNYDSLEAVTLMRTFTPPLIFVTANGMKKVDTFNHDTYTIHTNVGTLKKYQMLFTFQLKDAEYFGDNIRINKKIEAKKLRTRYHIAKRPPNVLTDDMLVKAAGLPIRCVLNSGHVLLGTLIEHNPYNFTMNINDNVVLVYRHAVIDWTRQAS